LRDQKVDRSWIGVDWQEIKEFKYYLKDKTLEGVLVAYVEQNSPAMKAGLKPGDLVYSINNQSVSAVYKEELPRIRKNIAEVEVGSELRIRFLRNGKERQVTLTSELRGKFEGSEFECESWGLSVKELTPRIIKNLNLKDNRGVLVSGVRSGSIADEADVFRGNVIRYVDDIEISDLEFFKEVFAKRNVIPDRGIMLELYYRNSTRFALIKEK